MEINISIRFIIFRFLVSIRSLVIDKVAEANAKEMTISGSTFH